MEFDKINQYTLEEIELSQGMDAFFKNGDRFTIDNIDIINARNKSLYYIKNIPVLDQIKTKKLFKLILAK